MRVSREHGGGHGRTEVAWHEGSARERGGVSRPGRRSGAGREETQQLVVAEIVKGKIQEGLESWEAGVPRGRCRALTSGGVGGGEGQG